MGHSEQIVIVERTWTSELLHSKEDFTLSSTDFGHRLAGTVRIIRDETPVEIAYRVDCAPDWTTMGATVEIPAIDIDLRLQVDSASWTVDSEPRTDLDGCVDVDLGFTPATNTLPIRRLDTAADISQTIKVAWLRWPELVFLPSDQTYTRQRGHLWTYASGEFSAELEVDEHGVVVNYGRPPIWAGA
jgi:uncharacterized protein